MSSLSVSSPGRFDHVDPPAGSSYPVSTPSGPIGYQPSPFVTWPTRSLQHERGGWFTLPADGVPIEFPELLEPEPVFAAFPGWPQRMCDVPPEHSTSPVTFDVEEDDDPVDEDLEVDPDYYIAPYGNVVPAASDSDEEEVAFVEPASSESSPEEEEGHYPGWQQVQQSSYGEEDYWVGEDDEEEEEEGEAGDEDYEDSDPNVWAAADDAEAGQDATYDGEDDEGDEGEDEDDDDYQAPSSRSTLPRSQRQRAAGPATSQPVSTTSAQPSSAVATSSSGSNRRSSSWSDAENAACIALMREICTQPRYAHIAKTEKRFEVISRRMKTEYGFDRKPSGVKMQWNRYLRARSGFEDRSDKKHSDSGLTTSSLNKSARNSGSLTSSSPANGSGQSAAPVTGSNQPTSSAAAASRRDKGKQRATRFADDEDDDEEDEEDDIPLSRRRGSKRPRQYDDDDDDVGHEPSTFNHGKRTRRSFLSGTQPVSEYDTFQAIIKAAQQPYTIGGYESASLGNTLSTSNSKKRNHDDVEEDDEDEVISNSTRVKRSRLARQQQATLYADEDEEERNDSAEAALERIAEVNEEDDEEEVDQAQIDRDEQMRMDEEFARQLQAEEDVKTRARRGRGFR